VTTQPATGVPVTRLKQLAAAQARWPDHVTLNRRLQKQLEARAETVAQGGAVSWAVAESLAFASLLADKVPVRLTGEDTRRGTFSQRHGVLMDEVTEAPYVPLNHLVDGQAQMETHDSPLSEEAVLAFEYGHSLADPKTLVVWEAQFGDFANVAQVFIDQYIASGEEKWLRSCGLVLLLPHGLEGGGPEHSSARLERFLQLCAKGNMHVVNCTTPANHFHALRRQMCRDFRKPLIAMTPKLMLRHKQAVSGLSEMGRGTRFEPVLADGRMGEGAQRVVLCSGRAYYELDAAREERGRRDIALVRLEELYPFPARELANVMKAHPGADVVWCQEEPENMGACSFAVPRIGTVLKDLGCEQAGVECIARPANPSPAPGFRSALEAQKMRLIDAALG
jgi:2-oxoglutarate dehydrogenase E1 component